MRLIFISSWFSENMGYAENFLPKAFAKLGHEVHLVTSTAQVYYNSKDYKKTYEPFIGKNILDEGVKMVDGFTFHRLPFSKPLIGNTPIITGLYDYLMKLKPDIIQTFEVTSRNTYNAAQFCKENGVSFFTESHVHASVFNSNDRSVKIEEYVNRVHRNLKLINEMTVIHYPIAKDVLDISRDHFKIPIQKIKMQSLGVDADLFFPYNETLKEERGQLRVALGFEMDDIVCVYTGRFTEDKNPLCLAQAVDHLQNSGETKFKALFVGSGTDENLAAISSMKGCKIHSFVKVDKLPPFYRVADIGVWPKQESTSQLDAMASGLPTIVSNKVKVTDRIDGNGFLYEENNHIDLANKILLLKDATLRAQMGAVGIGKIKTIYSWEAIANHRLLDYIDSI